MKVVSFIVEVSKVFLMLHEYSVSGPEHLLPGGCLDDDLLECPLGKQGHLCQIVLGAQPLVGG